MSRLSTLLLVILPLFAFSQQEKHQLQVIKNWDTAYCYYYELGEKIQNLYFAYDKGYEPKYDFKDVMYKTPSGERIIYVTSKIISSPKIKKLTRYYNIEFEGLDTSLNIGYHPFTIENFNQDIVKYQLIRNSALDKDAVYNLISNWRRKANVVTDEEFAESSSCNYNSSPYSVDAYADSSYVSVRGNEVYIENTLFARYSSNKMTYATHGASMEDMFFYFTTPGGIRFAEVRLIAYYPYIYISSPYLKESLRAYIPVREEKRLVMTCAKILNACLNNQ
jgi:hypothetical protein